MTAEINIQNEIRRTLPLNGHFVYRVNVGKVKTIDGRWFDTGLPPGFPDTFGWRKSDKQIFFIEVKNEKGKAREAQVRFHEFLKNAGIIHGIARNPKEALMIVEEGLIGYGFE